MANPRIQQLTAKNEAPASDDYGVLVRVIGGATGGDGSIIDGVDPLIKATVKDYPNSNPLAVITVDTNGDPVTGTGGGPATIADGADVAEGSTTDIAVIGDNPGTISAKLRGLNKSIAAGLPITGALTDVQLRATPVPVSGTVTANAGTNLNTSALALEAGNLATVLARLTSILAQLDVLSSTRASEATLLTRTKPADQQHVIVDSSAAIAVTGPLTDTQLRAAAVPISGTVTVNAGVNLNTSALAIEAGNLATILTRLTSILAQLDVLSSTRAAESTTAKSAAQTDGTQKSIVRGGAKGATTAADVTSTAQSVDRQGLDVQIRTSSGAAVDTFGGTALPNAAVESRVFPAWRQSVVLLAANANRKQGLIINGTNAPFFVKDGAAASDISFTDIVPPRGRYLFDNVLEIDGWWNENPSNGFVYVTERT